MYIHPDSTPLIFTWLIPLKWNLWVKKLSLNLQIQTKIFSTSGMTQILFWLFRGLTLSHDHTSSRFEHHGTAGHILVHVRRRCQILPRSYRFLWHLCAPDSDIGVWNPKREQSNMRCTYVDNAGGVSQRF